MRDKTTPKPWLEELRSLRAAGKQDEAEELRRSWILAEANRAEAGGQHWLAGILRRQAEGEDIVFRRECRACRLYFEPAAQNDLYCSPLCKEQMKQRKRLRRIQAKRACVA